MLYARSPKSRNIKHILRLILPNNREVAEIKKALKNRTTKTADNNTTKIKSTEYRSPLNTPFYYYTIATKPKKPINKEVKTMAEETQIPTIYVGKKPLIRYLMAAISILLNERPEKLRISARGRMISKAVDVAEMLKTRYLPGIIEIENIRTGTEELENPQQPGRMNRVSTIEIILKRTGEIKIGK